MDGFPEVGFSRSFFSPHSFQRSLEGGHRHHPPRHRVGEKPQQENSAQVSAKSVQASQATSADFNIVTKEGDKVTISGASRYDLSYSTYTASGRLNDQSVDVKGESFSLSASRELSIQVEGDLSEEELRDIRKLIKGSAEILGDFMRGDVDEAFEDTLKLGKLDSLASFEAELTISRSVSVAQVSAQSSVRPASDTTSEVQSGDALTPQEQVPAESKASLITAASTASLLLNIKGQIDNSGVAPEKLKSPFNDLFSNLAAGKGLNKERGNSKPLLLEIIQQQLLQYLNG